jgi:hypothetical protein
MHETRQTAARADEAPLSGVQSTVALDVDFQKLVLTSQPEPSLAREVSRLMAELGLSQYVYSTEALKSELQKLVLALHPDKSGGEFKSDRDKARFMKARRAIEVLNSGRLQHDAPGAAQLPGVLHAIGDATVARRRPDAGRRFQLRLMADARSRISRCFAAPKIGSASSAAGMLALGAFSDRFEGNPVLGPLLANPGSATFLFAAAFVSAMGFAALWLCQHSAERRAGHLMSEAALGEILVQASRCARRHGRAGRVSAFDIRRGIEILIHGKRIDSGRRNLSLFRGLDPATLESISAIQTQRLLDRRVLKVLKTPSIEVLYEVSPAVSI